MPLIKQNWLRQIRIYPTFKYNIYNTGSLFPYIKIVKIAFILKTIKENIEYLDEAQIAKLKEISNNITKFATESYVNGLPFDKSNFIYPSKHYASTTVDLIIDTDIQPLYTLFKKLDRIKYKDGIEEEKKRFMKFLDVVFEKLLDIASSIPEKKRKKIKRFLSFTKGVYGEN
ncbi:hypothetical protein [Caminibacter sp.]